MVIEVLYIGLEIPDIIIPAIVMMIEFMMMKVLESLQVMEYVEIGILRPDTLTITIVDFILW